MKSLLRLVALTLALWIVYSLLTFAASTEQVLRETINGIDARSAIVLNVQTGDIVWEQNAHAVFPIASLTKLMTAAVVIDEQLPLERMTTVTVADVKSASVTYLRPRDTVSVETLMYLMMVGSDNAAARILGRLVAQNTWRFSRKMNTLANALGMERATYVEPSGLLSGNQASAADLVQLLVHVQRQSESFLHHLLNTRIYQTRIGKRTVVVSNTNRYLNDHILATKTGYTAAAKYCLAFMFTAENGQQYAVVILGAPSSLTRFEISQQVYDILNETETESTNIDACGFQPKAISESGKTFIRRFESLRLTPYYDHIGYAVGYGMHTWQGQSVTRRFPFAITPMDVEQEFDAQLTKYTQVVKSSVCAPLSQPMMDSLVSIAWNLGRVNTSIVNKFERNRPLTAIDFLTTATVKRRQTDALVNRRLREYLMFTGDYDTALERNTNHSLRAAVKGLRVEVYNNSMM